MSVPAGTPAPRPVLDTILDLVLEVPRMLDKGHTRESIRVWLYGRVDAVAGGPPPPWTMDHPPDCHCNACQWDRAPAPCPGGYWSKCLDQPGKLVCSECARIREDHGPDNQTVS